MNETTALARMVPPGQVRPKKPRGGVLQIWITRACDKSCFACTQGSNLGGNPGMMSLEHFEQACESLHGYFGTVGIFGGNPAMHPQFNGICAILRRHFPKDKCGLWCNNPLGKGKAMRATFNPAVSNLNVHLDRKAYDEFRRDWPESRPFGLDKDSRHSPVYVAMKDVLKEDCPECEGRGGHWNGVGLRRNDWDCDRCNGTGKVYAEEEAWELISKCDINQHWSAMISPFRGELRGWFCEIAGAMSMLHQGDPDWPDTGLEVVPGWWRRPMEDFREQVRLHCHNCGVPLRGYGSLAQAESGVEQTSETHRAIFKPKTKGREVELVQLRSQLGRPLERTTDYLGNAGR